MKGECTKLKRKERKAKEIPWKENEEENLVVMARMQEKII
jgi:hypothetical protein